MLICQENNDFAISATAKSLGTSATIYLCVGKVTLEQHREKFVKEILNVNMNFKFRSFDYKSLFHYILSLNDHSIFNLTVKFIGDIMESVISKI